MGGSLSYPTATLSSERTFLITGANTGIGYETAKSIAQLGGRVVITCRTEEKAKDTIARMKKEHEEERKSSTKTETIARMKKEHEEERKSSTKTESATTAKLNLQYFQLELGSFDSVMDFVEKYKSSGLPLHVLICNAGLLMNDRVLTDAGYEMHFHVNYLSHLLLTLHLLGLIKASGPNSRIINVSSSGHVLGKWNITNAQAEKSFSSIPTYGNSKLFQVMNMYTLSEKLSTEDIGIFSVHPGLVKTDIGRGMKRWYYSLSSGAVHKLGISRNWKDGSMTTLVAALDQSYNGKTALYFDSCKPIASSSESRNQIKLEELWRYSLECLKPYLTDEILREVGVSLSDIGDVNHAVTLEDTSREGVARGSLPKESETSLSPCET